MISRCWILQLSEVRKRHFYTRVDHVPIIIFYYGSIHSNWRDWKRFQLASVSDEGCTNHRLVAMKECHLSYYRSLSKSSDDIFELACREVCALSHPHSKAKLLKGMDHPNVMRCYDYFIEGNYLHMVMEYMGCGDLNHLVDLFQRSHQCWSFAKLQLDSSPRR